MEQSKAFMERNDPVANWLNERAEFGQDHSSPSQLAYESYVDWCNKQGGDVEAFSSVRWALELQKKGFSKVRGRMYNLWKGFRLLGAMALAEKQGVDEDEEP